jgi:hypothetical protein
MRAMFSTRHAQAVAAGFTAIPATNSMDLIVL